MFSLRVFPWKHSLLLPRRESFARLSIALLFVTPLRIRYKALVSAWRIQVILDGIRQMWARMKTSVGCVAMTPDVICATTISHRWWNIRQFCIERDNALENSRLNSRECWMKRKWRLLFLLCVMQQLHTFDTIINWYSKCLSCSTSKLESKETIAKRASSRHVVIIAWFIDIRVIGGSFVSSFVILTIKSEDKLFDQSD